MGRVISSLEPFLSILDRENIIKNPEVFNLDYVPPEIYVREELKDAIDNILIYLKLGVPTAFHLLIIGEKGSGKTVSFKFLAERLPKELNDKIKEYEPSIIYLPCWKITSSYWVYLSISGAKKGEQLPVVREKALNKLRENKRTILILDDIDHLRDDDLLYYIPRETNALMILITRDIGFMKDLSPPVKSSFVPKIIKFVPYRVSEVREILLSRAKLGLERWDEGVIDLIASFVVNTYNSDVRIGIRALELIALHDEWDHKKVPEFISEAVRDIELSAIRLMDNREILVMASLLMEKRENEAFKLARKLGDELNIPLSKTSFYDIIYELEHSGIITKKEARTKKGRTYIIDVNLTNRQYLIERAEEIGIKVSRGVDGI